MLEAVIFDLDGVLVTTDELHFKAWKSLADSLGINDFNEEDNLRQRGVSRMASLEVILEKTTKYFTDEEKVLLADQKNKIYQNSLQTLSSEDVLPGVFPLIKKLKKNKIRIALGSASKNAPLILEKTELWPLIDSISCGLDTIKSKPHPEVFLKAAEKLGIAPENCLVVEDADSGVSAGKAAEMKVLAVAAAQQNSSADFSASSLNDSGLNWDSIIKGFEEEKQ